MAHPSELRPSAALVAYSESLIEGRRVLVFGDATSGLADALLERGARLVHLCDPDPARAVEAAVHNRSRNVFLGPLNQSALEQRDGSFDFGIIDNLGALGDLATVLRRLARALTPRGAAIIAAANAEASLRLLPERDTRATALDYYKVYDAVALEFPHLRMLGLAPFVGYALADFGLDSDPEPAIDTDYIPRGAEEPEWFVALASRLPLRLEPYALIQLPMKRALESWRSVDSSASSTQENGELGALKKELRRLRTWIDELESRAATADQRADDTQSQLEQAEMELESLRAQPNPTVADFAPTASASDELVQQMSAQNEQLTLENQKLSQAVAQGAERISELAAVEDTDQARELEQLEKQLFERGE
ncbi:MAG TPA: hypothetical protein VGJ84_14550, partial [Polyangiaceae bacterium]